MKRLVLSSLVVTATACVSLPNAGSGSTASGKPSPAFPVAFSGEGTAPLPPAAPPPNVIAKAEPPAPTSAPTAPPPVVPPPATAKSLVGAPQRTAYALVVGIEKYRDVPAAPGARADAEAFASLLKTTFGLPEENVHTALDDHATKSDLDRQVEWLKSSVPPGGRAYFFYSGHGTPDTKSGAPYLVPYDASTSAVTASSVAIADVLAKVSASRAKDAIAFVDACFSGTGRSILPAGARPLVPIKDVDATTKLAVFTSASGSEIAGPTADGKSGLFTQTVIDGIKSGQADEDGDGQLTVKELAQFVQPRVSREAKKAGRDQTPKLTVGKSFGDAKDIALLWGLK